MLRSWLRSIKGLQTNRVVMDARNYNKVAFLPMYSRAGFSLGRLRNVLSGSQAFYKCKYQLAARSTSRSVISSTAGVTTSQRTETERKEGAESGMFATNTSFVDLGVSHEIVEHLATCGIKTPTRAQASIIPLLLQGLSQQTDYALRVRAADEAEAVENGMNEFGETVSKRPRPPEDDFNDVIMFGAETGSGKTLAYLLPYVEAARATTLDLKAVILVPSRELCWQVSDFLKQFFPDAPRHIVLAGGQPLGVGDAKGIRTVIATPTALLNYFRFSTKIDVSDKMIIVDEADMLLTGSFLRDVERILDQPGMKPFATRRNKEMRILNRNRLVFVGATYPHWTGEKVRSIVTWMKRRYPGVKAVQTADIHKKSNKVESQWRYLPTEAERIEGLVEILREVNQGEKVMVFANKAETCGRVCDVAVGLMGKTQVEEVFGEVVQLHKHVHAKERKEGLKRFRSGEARLLFCTDLGARGLDLGQVTRIVEFEFATNVVGYLHRMGRTARAGASGNTVHFYDEVSRPLAEAIRERADKEDTVVEGVFSRNRSFRRKLKKRESVVEGLENVSIDPVDAEEEKRWEG